MTGHAIIAGSFSDFRIIKTRSTAQLIIEIPIEHADEALERLGGVPQSGKERPVAVARLNLDVAREPAPQAPEKPKNGEGAAKRMFKELPRSQQAGILCNEGAFSTFLRDMHYGALVVDENGATDPAATLRHICRVESRREFDLDKEAGESFDQVREDYRFWLDVP